MVVRVLVVKGGLKNDSPVAQQMAILLSKISNLEGIPELKQVKFGSRYPGIGGVNGLLQGDVLDN